MFSPLRFITPLVIIPETVQAGPVHGERRSNDSGRLNSGWFAHGGRGDELVRAQVRGLGVAARSCGQATHC